jgi:PAS domain S-box-containing protein
MDTSWPVSDPVEMSESNFSDRESAELALRASESRYRRLFEAARDGILILDALTGRIVDVNPFLIDLLGYSHTEYLGKHLWEIGPFKNTVVSKAAFDELQRNGYTRYEDLPLETKDRREIQVEFVSNVYQVNDESVIQCNIRDITERKHAEEHLRNSEEQFRQLVESAPDAILLYDCDQGHFVQANKAAERLFGRPRDEIVKYGPRHFYPP